MKDRSDGGLAFFTSASAEAVFGLSGTPLASGFDVSIFICSLYRFNFLASFDVSLY